MSGRYPAGRTPVGRSHSPILLAVVKISATGGGYKHSFGGAESLVNVYAEGGGIVIDALGGSEALVLITAEGAGEKLSEDLYFIDEPTIRTQGVKATHVTVVSPTHTYTAEIPATPVEEVIERIMTIDDGDEAVCQVVADRLLDEWGREQVSVSGEVPFTVKLRFRDKVKVRIPIADIDQEMVLQSKEHNLSSFSTRVNVGDIILGDNELLARILEEL